MARRIARPPDAVRVGWVYFNPSRIRLHDRQRELHPRLRLWIEAGDLVRRLFAQPDHLRLWIGDREVGAIVLGRRLVEGHLAGDLVDLYELAGLMEADPNISLPIGAHPARNVHPGSRELVDLSAGRVEPAYSVGFSLDKPNPSIPRDI